MSSEEKEKFKILHVANISMAATKDHVYNLFNYIGKVQDLKIYPSDMNITSNTTSKAAFVKFDDERCVEVGQHLTNTVLIDRALVCIPYAQQVIPDEETFFNSGGSISAGQRQLPPHVVNKVQDAGDGTTLLLTVDPTLEQLGLPQYPTLPGDTDAAKVEEIRRTVYVGNLPKNVDVNAFLEFINMYIGEVMYIRMATGPAGLPCAYAYVEFTQQSSIPIALQNNGLEFQERPLRIQHSRVAIIKPQAKTDTQALEEVEEAIRLGKTGDEPRERKRSRSPKRRRSPSPRRRTRSPARRRSRSRGDRDRRRSSRERGSDRDRDRDRGDRSDRDRDRDRKRSRSRDRKKRSKSREKDSGRDRKRSRSRDRRRRSRSRGDRKRDRSRDRSKSRDRKRDRKRSRTRSPERPSKREKEDRKEKVAKDESDDERLLREKLLSKKAARKDSSEDEWEEAKPKVKTVAENGDAPDSD